MLAWRRLCAVWPGHTIGGDEFHQFRRPARRPPGALSRGRSRQHLPFARSETG